MPKSLKSGAIRRLFLKHWFDLHSTYLDVPNVEKLKRAAPDASGNRAVREFYSFLAGNLCSHSGEMFREYSVDAKKLEEILGNEPESEDFELIRVSTSRLEPLPRMETLPPEVVAEQEPQIPRLAINLSNEQLALFDYIEGEHTNIFVTGRAGTGKSTLLTYLIENTKKKFAVCAPTGVAALNVSGQTIHSLFGLPLGLLGTEDVARHLGRRSREVLRSIEMLVIDEISMVSADLLDAMNRMLIAARGRNRGPFGGVQVVMFGDPYQLAPVPPSDPAERGWLAENYQSNWFFDAHVWRDADLERYELNEIFRQHDEGFKTILNAIRDGSCTQEMLDEINRSGNRFPPHDDVIRLCTVNSTVDNINSTRLSKLTTPIKSFEAKFATGDAQTFGRALPVEPTLVLKEGAQVMFVKNDDQSNRKTKEGYPVKRWVNGTIGHVNTIINDAHVVVEVDGDEFDVTVSTWEKVRYEIEEEFDEEAQKLKEVVVPIILAEYQQIPLRLAWAVTVHKSQGQTYDEVQIDMGRGAFSPGQTYVALSRVRSLEGLYLTRAITMKDIMVDEDVLRFMSTKPNAALERII